MRKMSVESYRWVRSQQRHYLCATATAASGEEDRGERKFLHFYAVKLQLDSKPRSEPNTEVLMVESEIGIIVRIVQQVGSPSPFHKFDFLLVQCVSSGR